MSVQVTRWLDERPVGTTVEWRESDISFRAEWDGRDWKCVGMVVSYASSVIAECAEPGSIRVVGVPVDSLTDELVVDHAAEALPYVKHRERYAARVIRSAIRHVTGVKP